ncbi:MAG: glycosyltransferase [Flavisolibacter sp.]|nr:glycosyltransferase [Flavisolibacter sp.]
MKVTLPALIDACRKDEEIVVYDGESTDGTKEFLEELYQQKKIHQFVSEKDFGEANGYNKAMLNSRGEIIKIISDDDAYDFDAIRFCKDFMLQHKGLHLVAADGFGVNNLLQKNEFTRRYAINDFKVWKEVKKPFIFCGLSILLRKDAIPLLGLWSTNYLIIDFEYSLRVSSGKSKIGWFTGVNYVNIVNQRSNSGTQWKRMEIEKEQLQIQYFDKRPIISFKQKDGLKNLVRPLKRKLISNEPTNPLPYHEVYEQGMQLLKETNRSLEYEVLV